MKLSIAAGILVMTATTGIGCEDPKNLTCAEIRAEIAELQKPDRYPGANIEGAVMRQAGKDSRTQALKAAAWDKECKK